MCSSDLAFSSCSERGLLFVAVRGLPIAVASLAGSTDSRCMRFHSCGAQAQQLWLAGSRAQVLLLCGMWDPPGPGLEPVSPALAGGFLTTAPPGKPTQLVLESMLSDSKLSVHSTISQLLH